MSYTTARPPLTVRRTLVVVGIAVVAPAVLSLGGAFALSAIASTFHDPSNPFAGLGVVIIGAIVLAVVDFALSVVVVAVGLRGRALATRFTLVFALVLAAGVVLALPASGYEVGYWLYLLAPALWTVPAAVVGLLRLRWVLTIAAAGLAVALAITGIRAFADNQQQRAIDAAYSGPVYAPSRSPESPLAGYTLREVDLPDQYLSQVELLYFDETAGVAHRTYYTLEFTEGTKELLCGGNYPACPEVGSALGAPVLFDDLGNDYYVAIHGGTIALQWNGPEADALRILRDLRPATLDQLSRLKVDKP